MRFGFRVLLCLAIPILPALYVLVNHIADLCDQYSAGHYLYDNFKSRVQKEKPHAHDPEVRNGDKIIVMAKLEEENTDWVENELPEYVIGTSSPL